MEWHDGARCPLAREHEDPFHNLWDKVDIFILSHLLGYWCKVGTRTDTETHMDTNGHTEEHRERHRDTQRNTEA